MKICLTLVTLILIGNTAMASTEVQIPHGVSEESWNAYIEHKKSWDALLKERFETVLKATPPKPPWEKYPEHESNSIFWRMGTGEEYLVDYFRVYLMYADEDELKSYKSKYPAPDKWKGWYEN